MAYYPKYNHKKSSKKAFVGAALALAPAAIKLGKGIGAYFAGRKRKKEAQKAMDAFDTESLQRRIPKSLRKMADEPISQEYVEGLQQQQAVDRASAMGALSRDPRATLAGVQALGAQASKDRLTIMGMQQDAKTQAMTNLAEAEAVVDKERASLAGKELEGIKGELVAAQTQQMAGFDTASSGLMSGLDTAFQAKEGANISEDGGVTPDEFNHDSNPIDLVQDGEKIGEATGGELILPPDDVEAIREALQREDKDAAFELMKKLVEKYDSNTMEKKEEEETEGPIAKEGGYLSRLGDFINRKF